MELKPYFIVNYLSGSLVVVNDIEFIETISILIRFFFLAFIFWFIFLS